MNWADQKDQQVHLEQICRSLTIAKVSVASEEQHTDPQYEVKIQDRSQDWELPASF